MVLEGATGGMGDGMLYEGVGAELALDSRSNPKRPVLTDKVAVLYVHGDACVYSGSVGWRRLGLHARLLSMCTALSTT